MTRADLRRLAPRLAAYALLAAIAVMAAERLVGEIIDGLGADPGRLAWLLLLVPVAAAAAALARWAPRERASLLIVPALLGLHVGLRVLAVAIAPAPVVSDWARYHDLALEILASGPRLDVVPTGFPMLLAVAYGVGGADPGTGQLLQLVIGAAIGATVYVLAATAWDHRIAAVGLLLVAVAPSQILLGTVLASEPLYTLLLLLAVLVALRMPRASAAVGAGLLLGASQYVRSTSLALVPVVAALGWWWGDGARPRWQAPAILVATFLAVLVPVMAWNLAEVGAPTLSSSRVQNFSLLVGLNQEADGRFNLADFEAVGSEYGTPSSEAIAGRLAAERLRSDPVGSIGLALRKARAWGDEDYGSFWAFGVADDRSVTSGVTVLLSQAWWAVVTLLAAAAIAFTTGNRLTQVTVLAIVAIGLVHLVLEAQGRYHAYVVPLVAILAAAAIGGRLRIPRAEAEPRS